MVGVKVIILSGTECEVMTP